MNVTSRTVGSGDQILGDFRRRSEHEVEDSGWQSRIGEGADQLHGAGRCLLGCLENNGATRRERSGDFAGRRNKREIPGRKRGHDADRLTQDGMPHARFARNDAAIEPTPLGRVPFDDLACPQDLLARLCDRLALLERHHDRHLLGALSDELRCFEDDLGAFRRRSIAPNAPPLACRCERSIEIGLRRVRNGPDHALVGRVQNRLPISRFPPSGDVELQIGIGGHPVKSCWKVRALVVELLLDVDVSGECDLRTNGQFARLSFEEALIASNDWPSFLLAPCGTAKDNVVGPIFIWSTMSPLWVSPSPDGIDRQWKGWSIVHGFLLRLPAGLPAQHQQQGDESLNVVKANQKVVRLITCVSFNANPHVPIARVPVPRDVPNNTGFRHHSRSRGGSCCRLPRYILWYTTSARDIMARPAFLKFKSDRAQRGMA